MCQLIEVLKNLTKKYSFTIPLNKFSWTKWQWKEKSLYEEVQSFVKKKVEKNEEYCCNRLYFEMKELWKAPSTEKTQQKGDYTKVVKMKRASGKDYLKTFLEQVIIEINKQKLQNIRV